MNISRQNWLGEALELRGVRAAGLFGAKRAAVSASNDSDLTESSLATVWRHLADTMDVGAHHRLPAQEMRWIFEKVLLYCQRRADGMMLALVVGRDTVNPFDAAAAERLFEAFKNTRDA
jgi:hypothetical protein